jgi:hypothetical protein
VEINKNKMARDDKGKKRRDRRALRREAKKPVQQQNVPQEGSTLSNVVSETSVTDNTQTPPPSSPSVSASSFDFSGMNDEQEIAAIENKTKELVAKLKPTYINRMGGNSSDADAERILLNKPIQQLEQEAKQLELGLDIFESKQPSEQLRTLAELPDADKEALAQDKNIATSLMNDAASNPNLTSGEYADAAEEASNIEKEVNKKNTEDVLSLNNQGDNLAQAQTGGEGQTEQTGGAPPAAPIAGTGETLTSIAPPTPGQRPDIINQPNAKVQIGSSIIKGAPNQSLLKQLNAANKISTIEDLDVKDYFPEAGRDIAVGNFTGSRIGSQTIYSGAGVLAPIGLYEARKRAMKNEAQNKIKLINDILQIPDAPKQFQVKYGDAAHDRLMGILNEVDFDVNKLYANPEAIKEINRIKNVATDMHHYDKWAQDLIDAAAPKEGTGSNRYVSKDMLEYARKIKSAMVQDVDKIVNGEQSLQQYFEDAGVYLNPYKWADETAKTIFSPNNLSQSPLRLKNVDEAAKEAKTKGEPFDAVAYEKERNDYIASVNDGNKATDTYVTGLVKFFDSDNLRNMVEAAYQGQNFPGKTKEDVYKYLLSQAPVQTVLDYKTNANAYIAEMQESGRNRRQDKELAMREKETKRFFDNIEDEGYITDRDIAARLTGDPAKDDAIIRDEMQRTQSGGDVRKGVNGQWVIDIAIPKGPNSGVSKATTGVKKYIVTDDKGNVKNLTGSEIQAYNGKLYGRNRKEITPNDRYFFAKADQEGVWSEPEVISIQKGFQSGSGGITYLKSDNALQWKNSDKKVETSTIQSRAQYRGKDAQGDVVYDLPALFVDDTSTINHRSESGKDRGNKTVFPESSLQKKTVSTSTTESSSSSEIE